MREWQAVVGAGLCALSTGCCSVDATALDAWLRTRPEPPAFVQAQGDVRIESPQWSGDFTAVLLVRREPLAVRLQMFPDIGGKVLDLMATAEVQRGVLPATGAVHDVPNGKDDRLLGMFATSLLALHTPPEAEAIRCLSTADGSTSVRFASGHSLRTTGRRTEHELSRRGVRWRVVRHDDRRAEVLGKRFRMTVDITDVTHPTSLAPELFELTVR